MRSGRNAAGDRGRLSAAAPLGRDNPAARQICIDAMSQRHRRHRHTRRLAGRDNLRLELFAVNASAPTAHRDARFVRNSVHVSTKKT